MMKAINSCTTREVYPVEWLRYSRYLRWQAHQEQFNTGVAYGVIEHQTEKKN